MNINLESKTQRVLIADCDAEMLRNTSQSVECVGYKVVQAKDGKQALRILQSDSKFDICIFESNLPLMQAMEIVRYMRNESELAQIPIILMGANGSVKTQAECFSVEDVAFMPKPFRQNQLLTMISILTQSRLKRINRLNQASDFSLTNKNSEFKYDRRFASRIKVNFEANWKDSKGQHRGKICNISTHGCYVNSREKVEGRELVLLDVHLAEKDRIIKAWGTVANSLPEVGFGVRFTNINRDDSNLIREMVKKSMIQPNNLQ